MILNTNVLLGNKVLDNAIPKMTANYALRFGGGSKEFCITDEQLSTHLLLLGATGTGKTNTIFHIINQLKRKMGERDVMLVFDSKLDFKRFHSPKDVIVSNRSCNGIARADWNIFMDIVADGWGKSEIELNADEIASTIFYESIKESSQPFFPKAARDIFSAVLKGMAYLGINDTDYRVKYLNNASLKKYLSNLNAKRLREFLEKVPELNGVLKYVGNGSSDQALGVFAELQSVTSKLFIKCFGNDGRFSVRKMEKQKGGKTLFIEYDPSCGASFQPIYRVLVDLFIKEALSPETNNGHVYIICDELKMLPYLSHFEDALNFGRSLGITVIAGIQSMEQLYEVYGEFGGRNIASGFQNTMIFRTNNAASREYAKNIHGQNYSVIQYLDSSKKPSETIREGYSVEDWDIVSLDKGEAIIGLVGERPFKFYIERYR